MKTATVRDLRNRFPRVASWLAEGEPVEITKSGKPFARLLPAVPEKPRRFKMPDIMARLTGILATVFSRPKKLPKCGRQNWKVKKDDCPSRHIVSLRLLSAAGQFTGGGGTRSHNERTVACHGSPCLRISSVTSISSLAARRQRFDSSQGNRARNILSCERESTFTITHEPSNASGSRSCPNLARSADCPQSAAAGRCGYAASWDNSPGGVAAITPRGERSACKFEIQIRTLPGSKSNSSEAICPPFKSRLGRF